MRFDLLKKDVEYFAKHFPKDNYDMYANESKYCKAEHLENYLEKGWNVGSGIKLNFFEALCWHRLEDMFEFKGFTSYSINEHDTEYTYDSMEFQDWVLDDCDKFCEIRYASGVYNLPIRIVDELNNLSNDKHMQVEYILQYIADYEALHNE